LILLIYEYTRVMIVKSDFTLIKTTYGRK